MVGEELILQRNGASNLFQNLYRTAGMKYVIVSMNGPNL
jgi:hypothetical protein